MVMMLRLGRLTPGYFRLLQVCLFHHVGVTQRMNEYLVESWS